MLLAACASGGAATPTTARPTPSVLASTSATVSLPATPSPTPVASSTEPRASATPRVTPVGTPPAVETFWDAVRRGLAASGRLRINVIGPNAGVLRYQPDASETVADGKVVFVCLGGGAFDGQSGSFVDVPGSWECGAAALVGGFRNTGQPVDAWNESLPTDSSITETTAVEPDGRWRWDYTAQSAVFGGRVATTVWVDPVSGRILDARRSDPAGATRYGISYEEAFPPIVRP